MLWPLKVPSAGPAEGAQQPVQAPAEAPTIIQALETQAASGVDAQTSVDVSCLCSTYWAAPSCSVCQIWHNLHFDERYLSQCTQRHTEMNRALWQYHGLSTYMMVGMQLHSQPIHCSTFCQISCSIDRQDSSVRRARDKNPSCWGQLIAGSDRAFI